MKKITLLLLCLATTFVFSQVGINENFDSGTPTGWTDTYSNSSADACAGNSERDNLFSSSTTGDLTSPNQVGASNATDLTISFDYKIEEWNSTTAQGAGWGSAELQYSIDDGGLWTTVLTIDDSNHVVANTCVSMMVIVPATSLPMSSDVKLRIFNTWVAGDYDFYVDNFSASQVVSNPPNCDSVLTETTNVDLAGDISWSAATGASTGYKLIVGTTTGGNDILALIDVGNLTTYNLGTLIGSTTYYVTITPYNSIGDATGCTEQTFTSFTPVANDTFAGAIPITPSTEGTGCASFTFTYTSAGTSDSGMDDTCATTNTGLDRFYSWTATSDALIWNDGTGGPGIAIWDATGNTVIACTSTFASDDFELSGWSVGDNLVIQIYDFSGSVSDISFCLEEYTLPTCPDPTALTVSNITETSADLGWTENGSATLWNVELGSAGFTATGTATDTGVANPFSTTTLTSANDYEFYVQSDCMGEVSAWVGPFAFSTLAPPPPNDDCANATLVDGTLPYNDTLNASGATNTGGFITPTGCGSGMNDGVWYTFTPITGGTVDIAVTGVTGWDPELAIYSGSCGTYTCIDSVDSGGTGADETLTGVTVVAGTQYFINIGYWSNTTDNSEGPFTIDISTQDVGLSIEDNIIEGFSLYPNPVNDRLLLSALDNIDELSVYNLLGQEVLRAQPRVLNTEVDMSNLPTGMYVVKVQVGEQLGSYRIIKE